MFRIGGKRKHKFNAKPQRVDGIYFPSTGEANRYAQLRLLEQGGAIRDLKIHPLYPIEINGIRCGTHKPDFAYLEKGSPRVVIEEFKGKWTADAVFRSNVFKALYQGIDYRVIETDENATRREWEAKLKAAGQIA